MCNCFPDLGSFHLHKVKLFSICFLSDWINVSLSGASSIVPQQSSMRYLASPRQVKSFNTLDLTDTDAQARQTLKTHHTHCDTSLHLTSWDNQENLSNSKYTSLYKVSGLFKTTKRLIARAFYIWTFWLSRSVQLTPALERPDWYIHVDFLITLDLLGISLRNSLCKI